MRADLKLSRGASWGRSAAGREREVCGQLTSIPDRLNPGKSSKLITTEPTGIQVPREVRHLQWPSEQVIRAVTLHVAGPTFRGAASLRRAARRSRAVRSSDRTASHRALARAWPPPRQAANSTQDHDPQTETLRAAAAALPGCTAVPA